MDGFVSTSLRRAPSGFTDQQVDARQQAAEEQYFERYGKVIVDEADCKNNPVVHGWFKNLVKKRFGRGI